MLFNSLHFLVFFPVVVLLYFLIPHRFRWIWLLISSYYFYMSWNPTYALLMGLSSLITWLSGLLIEHSGKIENEKTRFFQRKLWVALSFSSNLAILFFFKYFDFAVSNINQILNLIGIEALRPSFDVLLPVGISFYTFQALSYTMDVYREELNAEKNIAKYALFVSFFPQLVAGPIERSKNLLSQIHERHDFDYDNVKNGLLLMLWGFFQKLVVADHVAIIVNTVYDNYKGYHGFQIALATVLFAFQIYCDFSGYSDIARGAAQVMGFRLMDNFKQPYFAESIRDFWQRWHISLSTWFRDYLYIPLGGSRCSQLKKFRNIMIVFLLSGLWHGANWTFVAWGGLHGFYQVIGDVLRPYKNKLRTKLKLNPNQPLFKGGRILLTFILVDFAWIFFRAPDIHAAFQMISRMIFNFGFTEVFSLSSYSIGVGFQDLLIIAFSIPLMLSANFMQSKVCVREVLARQSIVVRWFAYYAMTSLVLIFGVLLSGTQAQFIYFQF